VGQFLGILAFYFWKNRRMIAIKNIESVRKAGKSHLNGCNSEKDSFIIAKNSFKNLGISLVEITKIYCGLGNKIINNVEIKGIQNYLKAKSKNKGIIFFTGHCGNWELMALTFGLKIDNISVVARHQNNPYLNKIIEKIRARFGNKVIYKKGAIKQIISELKKNRPVGILADQAVLKAEGYKIEFLGLPAWTSKLPVLLARKTGASIVPAFINREGKKHIINIYPEVFLSKEPDSKKAMHYDTAKLSKLMEDYVKKYPSEWLWIHRRWKRA
jgi:KDO2-lipid IV(A) lauroyltransferase